MTSALVMASPRLALALLPALAGAAAAHPHAYVDQQVQLSLGLDRAEVTVRIVPSVEDGPAILAHVDADGDEAVSDGEAQAFADAVAAGLLLTVDGEAVAFGPATARMAPAGEVRAGTGGLSVTAAASLTLAADAPHVIAFEVVFEDFAHEWFVQPFYRPDLVEAFGTPALARSDDSSEVTVELRP